MSKLAVITGGTKGIGRAIVEKFASQRFDIVTCSRKAEELEALKKELESAYPVKVIVSVADLSIRSQAIAFSSFVNDLKRSVDVLVNNAGFFVSGLVLEEKENVLESMIASNLYSAYHVTRGLAPAMKAGRSGHIFTIGSVASIKAYPNGGSYSIAKFALRGFSKVLREELKDHNVRVTTVLPGATRTASWEGSELPEDRFMRPEDVAEAVFGAYALSPRSVVEEILIRPQRGDI